MRRALLVSLVCLSVGLLMTGTVYAFHESGVARCSGCHTMHNSQNGVPIDTAHVGGNPGLLIRNNSTDVCLSCHAQTATSSSGYKVWSLNPLQPMIAGGAGHGAGDFVFQQEDNINDASSGSSTPPPIPGYKSGHTVVAPSKGVVADPTLTIGPGGNFPSSQLGCISCHDPHGSEAFRMLNGVGEISGQYSYTFTNGAPEADGISLSSSVGESNSNHTAYKSGMSEWCANCHGDYHAYQGSDYYHPSGVPMGNESVHYQYYNGTTQYETGDPATSYVAAVAFEDPDMTISTTSGPGNSSKVSCISCHRAHATSAPDAGRWDFNVQFLALDGIASGSLPIPNPWPASGAEQRSACNKCHVKDMHSEGANP